jgi:hypothetical protein
LEVLQPFLFPQAAKASCQAAKASCLQVELAITSPRGAGLAKAQTLAGAALWRARVSDAPDLARFPPSLPLHRPALPAQVGARRFLAHPFLDAAALFPAGALWGSTTVLRKFVAALPYGSLTTPLDPCRFSGKVPENYIFRNFSEFGSRPLRYRTLLQKHLSAASRISQTRRAVKVCRRSSAARARR